MTANPALMRIESVRKNNSNNNLFIISNTYNKQNIGVDSVC